MNLDGILKIAGMIVGVAAITTIVAHPQSASVIKAIGGTFVESLSVAQGGKPGKGF